MPARVGLPSCEIWTRSEPLQVPWHWPERSQSPERSRPHGTKYLRGWRAGGPSEECRRRVNRIAPNCAEELRAAHGRISPTSETWWTSGTIDSTSGHERLPSLNDMSSTRRRSDSVCGGAPCHRIGIVGRMLFSRDGDESSYWQQPYSAPIWPAASPVIFSVNGSSWNCELDACASFDVSGACASSVAESESSSTSSCGKSSVCAAAHSREGAQPRRLAAVRRRVRRVARRVGARRVVAREVLRRSVTCVELHSRSTQPGLAKLGVDREVWLAERRHGVGGGRRHEADRSPGGLLRRPREAVAVGLLLRRRHRRPEHQRGSS